jgi:hypothetical protein
MPKNKRYKIKKLGKKNCLGNNSSKKTIQQVIKYLAETKIKQPDKIKINSALEGDRIIKLVAGAMIKKRINFKKARYLKNKLELLVNLKIKFVFFNRLAKIPGPIKIIDEILLILPGDLPLSLHHENLSKKTYKQGRA